MRFVSFVMTLLFVQHSAFAQQQPALDTVTKLTKRLHFAGLSRTDTSVLKLKPSPLRLPAPSAGEAHYIAQYKACQQRQLSGFHDPQAANTYVPPPTQKPNILLRKRPKAPLRTSF